MIERYRRDVAFAVLVVALGVILIAPSQAQPTTSDSDRLASYIRSLMRDAVNVPPPRIQWNELVMLVLGGHTREAAYFERYVFGINMRNLAVDSLVVAEQFRRARDLASAQAYANRGARYLIGSRQAFTAAEQVFAGATYATMFELETFYRFTSTFARNLGVTVCQQVCLTYLDALFFPIDYAVNEAMYGRDEAARRAISELVAEALIRFGLGQFIDRENAELMDKSGFYRLVRRVGSTEDFGNTLMNMISQTLPAQERRALRELIQAGLRRILDVLLSPSTPVVVPPLGGVEVSITWRASSVRRDCAGPRDSSGRFWYDPAFDANGWSAITLPDIQYQTEASDRFYRGVFTLFSLPQTGAVTVASDDALWLYVNGTQVGHWGGECYSAGCVNNPLGVCAINRVVPPIDITRLLVLSRNVIAAHVTDQGQGAQRVFRLDLQITR